jgi:hypothetical protein
MSRALALIAALPATTALRREQLRLQVALIYSLGHVKGHASPEARAAGEQTRLLIEQAQMRRAGDDPDPVEILIGGGDEPQIDADDEHHGSRHQRLRELCGHRRRRHLGRTHPRRLDWVPGVLNVPRGSHPSRHAS